MSEIAQQIIHQFQSGHTSMSWLIVGPQGVGKKELIQEISKSLLGSSSGAQISGIKWIERGLTEESKKNFQKSILAGDPVQNNFNLDKKNEITMEEIRDGLDFISLKSTLPCKILVISLAEEMNENVQNALLKTLEEPLEKTLIFLLSENPNRLLPTILSRCQRIVLHPLSKAELELNLQKEYPNQSEISKIVQLSDGMPGIANSICKYDGLTLYNKLNTFLYPIEKLDLIELSKFLQDLDEKQIALLKHFLLHFLYLCAQSNDLEKSQQFSLLYTWVEEQFDKKNNLYLDDFQVLMDIILKITEKLS